MTPIIIDLILDVAADLFEERSEIPWLAHIMNFSLPSRSKATLFGLTPSRVHLSHSAVLDEIVDRSEVLDHLSLVLQIHRGLDRGHIDGTIDVARHIDTTAQCIKFIL